MLNVTRSLFTCTISLTVMTLAGCSKDQDAPSIPATKAPQPSVVVEAKPEAVEQVSELAGTSWRLVKIMEMDDNIDEPKDRSLYTLEFGNDGTAALRADCNRGNGSWTSESARQLQFGLIAATRAMCPPGSISEKYLAQFEWVRSYVMREGNLFLATMADGAIIEFEPFPAR